MNPPGASDIPKLNRQFKLAARPVGLPKESDFQLDSVPIPSLQPGQLLVQTIFLSVDPYMRGRMNGIRTYADPVNIGQLMVGATVGQVIKSLNEHHREGDFVIGYWGWQEFYVTDGKDLRKWQAEEVPISAALSVLGIPGMSAYFGLFDLCRPNLGETVLISGAAGAVGSIAGQLAKIHGNRVIGIAGSDEKVRWLKSELGFDEAFNYKTTQDYEEKLRQLCPEGIDCYFDNVGGAITDAVFPNMNVFGRVCICGQISQYNLAKPELGPRFLTLVLQKQLRLEGFIVHRFTHRFSEAFSKMGGWMRQGKLKHREQFVEGFENAPKAFIGMLKGENTGKMLVKVSDL